MRPIPLEDVIRRRFILLGFTTGFARFGADYRRTKGASTLILKGQLFAIGHWHRAGKIGLTGLNIRGIDLDCDRTHDDLERDHHLAPLLLPDEKTLSSTKGPTPDSYPTTYRQIRVGLCLNRRRPAFSQYFDFRFRDGDGT